MDYNKTHAVIAQYDALATRAAALKAADKILFYDGSVRTAFDGETSFTFSFSVLEEPKSIDISSSDSQERYDEVLGKLNTIIETFYMDLNAEVDKAHEALTAAINRMEEIAAFITPEQYEQLS